MKTNLFLAVIFFFLFCNSAHADIDQEFGKKTSWWTSHYNKFLGYLGLEKSYALVIGVGQYNDKKFSSLPSEKDAIRIKDYLINEAGFDHVRLITGKQVNLSKIRKLMIDHYPRLITSKDRFLFYWSGHGVTAGEAGRRVGYLPLQESSSSSFSTMLSMRNLSEWDKRLDAKQTLYLLDACFSGIAASKAMSLRQEQTIERVSRQSRQVLTAGLENQQTIAINDLDGGVFTKALLDGLRGHADTDKGPYSRDGVVTARELEEYIRERVDHERRRVNWPSVITPVLYNFSQYEGDFFFVWDKTVVKSQSSLTNNQPVAAGVVATGVQVPSAQQEQIVTNQNFQTSSSGNESQFFGEQVRKYNALAKLPPRNFIHNFKKGRKTNQYIDHGDETITDTNTGLMWKKCAEGLRGNNCSGTAKEYSWEEAVAVFKQYSFAGYNDWRLPTLGELSSLIDCGYESGKYVEVSIGEILYSSCDGYKNKRKFRTPTINLEIFPKTGTKSFFGGYAPYQFLTTTKNNAINFHKGHLNSTAGMFGDTNNVRLVRSIK